MQFNLTTLALQRRQLGEVMKQLQSARSQYMQYRSIALRMYQGDEAIYIVEAINQVIQYLYRMLQQCNLLDEQYAWMEHVRYGSRSY